MELAPGGVELAFEVTYDANNLNVGMSVYDTTAGSPVLVQGPTAMANLISNTYYGKFTPTGEHTYIIFKAVYTDNTLTTLRTDYAAGTESIVAESIGGGGGGGASSSGCAVIGFVEPTPTVIGIVQC